MQVLFRGQIIVLNRNWLQLQTVSNGESGFDRQVPVEENGQLDLSITTG